MGQKRDLSTIDEIILHCADTPNGREHSVEDIDRWHGERNFKRDLSIDPRHKPNLKHIGYHFVIALDGRWYSGRPLIETGAHCKGHNRKSIGVCLIGKTKYTQAQWNGLKELLDHIEIELKRSLPIKGHFEYDPNKTCPGFNVHYWITNGFNPDLNHVLNPPKTPIKNVKPVKEESAMPSWMTALSNIVNPVTKVIDELHTSDEEKLKLKHDMLSAQNELSSQVLKYESELMQAKSSIIVAEAKSQSWLARNWRPITMLTFLALIVADIFGLTQFRLSEQAWELLKIGIGGYVVGRSAEKIMPNVMKAMGK